MNKVYYGTTGNDFRFSGPCILLSDLNQSDLETLEVFLNGAELSFSLVIRRCKRLGRYNRDRPRPFSIEFVHHEDVAYIMENRGYLSEGVYVNHEYSPEIECRCRTMLPILRAARFIEGYKKQIRLDKDKVVIKGKDYDMSNIHDLPEDLNAFKVTSKESDDVIGILESLIHSQISSPLASP